MSAAGKQSAERYATLFVGETSCRGGDSIALSERDRTFVRSSELRSEGGKVRTTYEYSTRDPSGERVTFAMAARLNRRRRGLKLYEADTHRWNVATGAVEGNVTQLLALTSIGIVNMAEGRGLRITTWNGRSQSFYTHGTFY